MSARKLAYPSLNDWSAPLSDDSQNVEPIDKTQGHSNNEQAKESVKSEELKLKISLSVLILKISFFKSTSQLLDMDVTMSCRFSIGRTHERSGIGSCTYTLAFATTGNYDSSNRWYVDKYREKI